MSTSRRRDDMRAAFERAKHKEQAVADALATIEQFNSRLAVGPTGQPSTLGVCDFHCAKLSAMIFTDVVATWLSDA